MDYFDFEGQFPEYHHKFIVRYNGWSAEVKSEFRAFVNAVHESGMDWYATNGKGIRIGSKNRLSLQAENVLARINLLKAGPQVDLGETVQPANPRVYMLRDNELFQLRESHPDFFHNFTVRENGGLFPRDYIPLPV